MTRVGAVTAGLLTQTSARIITLSCVQRGRETHTDRPISQAVIEDKDHFRQRINHQHSLLGEGVDVAEDFELTVAANQLRLAGQLIFELGNDRLFVCCSGCESFDIVKYRSNASTQCLKCKHNKHNKVRYSEQK